MVGKRASEKPKHPNEDDDELKTRKTKSLRQIEQHIEQQQQQKQQYSNSSDNNSDYDDDDGAQPIGDIIRVSNDGFHTINHYNSFLFDENHFQLEDAVLVAPEEGKVKPSVAIIKDIFQIEGETLMVSAQRFYRPGEVEKKGGGTSESGDARELFYSVHLDEIAANSVMHNCVIHFVPLNMPLPDRKQHPGFIVRKFYDHVQQKVRNLMDKDYKTVLPPSAAAQ